MNVRYAVARVRILDKGARCAPYRGTYRAVTQHSPVLRDGWWGYRDGWRETTRMGAYSARV